MKLISNCVLLCERIVVIALLVCTLGNCYAEGSGEEPVDAEAQFNLGVCHANGDGVKKDFAEAARWLRKAAEQGDADAAETLRKLGL